MVDSDRLGAAYETARCDLLAEMAAAGHWIGRLSGSPLATAAAASALAIVERHVLTRAERIVDERRERASSELIVASLRWLARHQNSDGGWGDTDQSPSNLPATMLARAAFALTCVPADHPGLLERADRYLELQGGARALKRQHANEKAFAASILANAALAGLIPWNQVSPLAFEVAALPPNVRETLRLSVPRWELPALVAAGQARWFHYKPRNPLAYLARGLAQQRSLAAVDELQAEDGAFFQSTPHTALVVTALAGTGRAEHPIVRKGVEFLLNTVHGDGSWTITPNLATRNTALAVSALAAAGEDPRELKCLDWLLSCQRPAIEPQSSLASGGWAATDRPGGLPDTWSTSSALVALATWWRGEIGRQSILPAATDGVRWLLDAQNPDGGWPLTAPQALAAPLSESGSELTAQALRALAAWRGPVVNNEQLRQPVREQLGARMEKAIEAGLRFLGSAQQPAGCWSPRWFGNPFRVDQGNPVLGTALAVAALGDLRRLDSPHTAQALDWLAASQNADGSWGEAAAHEQARRGSVEETALAVEALLSCGRSARHEAAATKGIAWLVDAVEANRHQDAAPIGLWFGRLGYSERLCPLALSVSALGHAARRLLPAVAGPAVAPAARIGS